MEVRETRKMSLDLYREQILDLWRNPQNFGEINIPDFEAEDLNPVCGDEIKIQAKLQANNGDSVVSDCKFTGQGCAISQASASMLTQMIKGKKLADAAKLEKDDLLRELGINPGPARIKCALLALSVWKKALLKNVQEIPRKN